jgi:hypothetical protein
MVAGLVASPCGYLGTITSPSTAAFGGKPGLGIEVGELNVHLGIVCHGPHFNGNLLILCRLVFKGSLLIHVPLVHCIHLGAELQCGQELTHGLDIPLQVEFVLQLDMAAWNSSLEWLFEMAA